MRLLLLGAFPYPLAQGSQVYFQEQAVALREAGAEVDLLTYASGHTNVPVGSFPPRALEGFRHLRPPSWTAPRSVRSGPGIGKPVADAALAMTLRDAIASKSGRARYDAVLAHNAEACVIALGALRQSPIPIVYCAHTLLGEELSTYFKWPYSRGFLINSPSQQEQPVGRVVRRRLDAAGGRIDRWIARRVDGWIALTRSAERVMRHNSDAPGVMIPPPIPDPKLDAERLDPAETARAFGLEPNRFLLYSGNLDPYQELAILQAAARELWDRPGTSRGSAIRLVVATHDGGHSAGMPGRANALVASVGLELRQVASAAEMGALLAAARASVVTRLATGGFPIKLANALAVGTPPIAFHADEWGLEDGVNALVASRERPTLSLAAAIRRLTDDDALSARLGAGARRLYEARHRPEDVAKRTWALIEATIGRSAS